MSRAAAPFPLGAETSRTDRLEGGPGFSGTAGTCRVGVRNPGALCGRLGAGVVAYVPRYGAYVTLSRAPRGTALFPVHCCHSSLFVGSVFRYGSQWFASGATCRPSRIVALCRAAMRRYAPVRGSRYGSLWFGSPGSGVRRFASPSPAGGVTRPDMARILPGPRSGEYRTVSQCRAMARLLSLVHCPTVPPPVFEVARCGAMSRLVAGRRSPEVPAASPVERLPGLLRCLRIVSHRAGFFQGTGPPSGCRCPNTRRLGLR